MGQQPCKKKSKVRIKSLIFRQIPSHLRIPNRRQYWTPKKRTKMSLKLKVRKARPKLTRRSQYEVKQLRRSKLLLRFLRRSKVVRHRILREEPKHPQQKLPLLKNEAPRELQQLLQQMILNRSSSAAKLSHNLLKETEVPRQDGQLQKVKRRLPLLHRKRDLRKVRPKMI